MKRFIRSVRFVPARHVLCRQVPFFSLILLLLMPTGYSIAKPKPVEAGMTQQENALQMRKKNRERLMAKVKKRTAVVPLTPEQKQRETAKKLADRTKNREMLAMHARWQPGSLGGSDTLWSQARKGKDKTGRISPKLASRLHTVIKRLEDQLGKPYVWGGKNPLEGFDCSGLVFYAFNHVLERKLPRTANGMYQDPTLKHIRVDKLRRGDLVFFNINQRPGADHVGVYLGNDEFIEAPRSGLNIRISQLSDDFWQSHYLGARRILTEEATL
ncbi:C40 family peptidase [Citrobacter koseri]|uniref:C40 family peptidase n=1 Tax=Citrobacter TaxID=544 RepID=UPI00286841BB|nr:C40 family peptidase [Citrobacter koseri]MDT7452082.1 C40 family peptidase [Citrobacter koseri]